MSKVDVIYYKDCSIAYIAPSPSIGILSGNSVATSESLGNLITGMLFDMGFNHKRKYNIKITVELEEIKDGGVDDASQKE